MNWQKYELTSVQIDQKPYELHSVMLNLYWNYDVFYQICNLSKNWSFTCLSVPKLSYLHFIFFCLKTYLDLLNSVTERKKT